MLQQRPILVFPHGITLAHFVRPMQIGEALHKAGFPVQFLTSGPMTRILQSSSIPTDYIICEDSSVGLERLKKAEAGSINPIIFYKETTKIMRQYIDEEVAALHKYQPLAVIADARPTLRISCDLMNVPLITIANFFLCDPICPFGKVQRFFCQLIGLTFNIERKRRGLPWLGDITKYLTSDLTLIPDLKQYSGTKDKRPQYTHIGPIVWEPKIQEPNWIKEIESKKSIIYVSLGNSALQEASRIVIQALAESRHTVIIAKHGIDQAVFKNLPGNFYSEELLPGIKIASIADLVICQGGNGTIYQALSVGTPVLCIPDLSDQQINAGRVMELGIGTCIGKNDLNCEKIHSAIDQIIADDTFTQNALRFQKLIAAINPMDIAVLAISDFLERKSASGNLFQRKSSVG